MPNKYLSGLSIGLLLLLSPPLWAQQQTEAPPPDDAKNQTSKPEFSRRALPADTFKPSEEVSEDFPVPFPVDI